MQSSSSTIKRPSEALGQDLEQPVPQRLRMAEATIDEEYDELDEDYDDEADDERRDAVPAFAGYSNKSRQNEERRAFTASEEGQAKLAENRLSQIALNQALLAPLTRRLTADALASRAAASKVTIPSASTTSTSTSKGHVTVATLLNFLNTVRRGQSSMRYPLSPTSKQFTRFIGKVQTLTAMHSMVKNGKLFDPALHPAALQEETISSEEEEEEVPGTKSQEEEEEEEVIFKFYTRCTPLRPIEELLQLLQDFRSQYPIEVTWVVAQNDDLQRLKSEGASHARIFYQGTTIFTCLGRELKDEVSNDDHSLLKHWKTFSGDRLRVFHWKELDVQAKSRFDWRTDEAISGIEEVLVDIAGGPALTLNQHPGGFVSRIKPHAETIPLYSKLHQLKIPSQLTSSSVLQPILPRPTIESKASRCERINRMLDSLAEVVQKYPRVFKKPKAHGDFLKAVKRMATNFTLVRDNATRATIMKDQPEEALTVPRKMFDDIDSGRAPRIDKLLDEEVQGLISFHTGNISGTYIDKRFPMLDLWCVTIDHPDGWIIIQIIVLVIWIHNLKPRYVVIGAAKLLNLCIRGYFSSIFIEDVDALGLLLDGAFFSPDHQLTDGFLSDILRNPDHYPTMQPADRNQLLIVVTLLIWEDLALDNYIDYVGTVRVVRMGVRWVVTVAVYHGGSHAYLGLLRPFTVQLAQACRLMVELLDIVTSNLDVDGSKAQADAIAKEVVDLAVREGIQATLEKLRAEVRSIFKAWQSLKMLGAVNRQDADMRSEQHDHFSKVMSATMQAEDAKSLKAVGAPGSPERVVQVVGVLNANREFINTKNHVGIEPCPGQITSGPASIQALLWMIFSVGQGAAFGRTARGATRLPLDETQKAVDFSGRQLKRLQDARRKSASQDASIVTVSEALTFTKKPSNFVRLISCPHCPWVELVKRNKAYEDKFRHACPMKEGTGKIDLVDLEKRFENLKSEASRVAKGKSAKVDQSKLSVPALLQVWSFDGNGGLWPTCEDDPLVQSILSGIEDGTISAGETSKKNNSAIVDRSEKHGRLLLEDMNLPPYSERMNLVELKKCLEERSKAGLPMPASFTPELLIDDDDDKEKEETTIETD